MRWIGVLDTEAETHIDRKKQKDTLTDKLQGVEVLCRRQTTGHKGYDSSTEKLKWTGG